MATAAQKAMAGGRPRPQPSPAPVRRPQPTPRRKPGRPSPQRPRRKQPGPRPAPKRPAPRPRGPQPFPGPYRQAPVRVPAPGPGRSVPRYSFPRGLAGKLGRFARLGGALGAVVGVVGELQPFFGPHNLAEAIPDGWSTCCSISGNREMWAGHTASGCVDTCGYIWQVPAGYTPDALLWPGTFNYITFGPAAFGGLRFDVHSAHWIPPEWTFPQRWSVPEPGSVPAPYFPGLDPNFIPLTPIVPAPTPAQLPKPRPGYKPAGDPAPDHLVTPLEPSASPWFPPLRPYEISAVTSVTRAHGSVSPSASPKPAVSRSPHGVLPPGPRERERKRNFTGSGAGAFVWAVANALTEATDVTNAIYKALPPSVRRFKGRNGKWMDKDIAWQDRAKRIMANLDKVDIDQAMLNILANQMEDFVIGKFSQGADRANRNLTYRRPLGLGTGPGI